MFHNFICRILAVSILCTPVFVLAGRGPCVITVQSTVQNTIRCDGGVCLGGVKITPMQGECQNINENDCDPLVANLKVTYEAKKIHYTAAEMAATFGMGAGCALCAAGVVAILGGVFKNPIPHVYTATISATCGSGCAAYFYYANGCWFAYCEQDLNSRDVIHGGKMCW